MINVVMCEEVSFSILSQGFGVEVSVFDWCIDQRWVVLDDGVILKRMYENDFVFDDDGVSDSNSDIVEVVWNNSMRNQYQVFFGIDDEIYILVVVFGKVVKFEWYGVVDVNEVVN